MARARVRKSQQKRRKALKRQYTAIAKAKKAGNPTPVQRKPRHRKRPSSPQAAGGSTPTPAPVLLDEIPAPAREVSAVFSVSDFSPSGFSASGSSDQMQDQMQDQMPLPLQDQIKEVLPPPQIDFGDLDQAVEDWTLQEFGYGDTKDEGGHGVDSLRAEARLTIIFEAKCSSLS